METSDRATVTDANNAQLALPPNVVAMFCNLCDEAHEFWLHHLELFDQNPRSDELLNSHAGAEFARLSIISHEYSLLRVCRLHDKAVMRSDHTLGIDYVLRFGDWPSSVRDQLTKMAGELELFAVQIRVARNKAIVHSDLAALLAGDSLGAFQENAEVPYFETLQEFVNLVHDQVIGGIRPFSTVVKNDVAAFLETINPARALADRFPYKSS